MTDKGNTDGIKLLSGGKEVSKEALLKRLESYSNTKAEKKSDRYLANQTPSTNNLKVDKVRYYITEKGEILKIISEELCCYRLDFNDKVWIEDAGLFAEFEHSNIKIKPITFEDIYESKGEVQKRIF